MAQLYATRRTCVPLMFGNHFIQATVAPTCTCVLVGPGTRRENTLSLAHMSLTREQINTCFSAAVTFSVARESIGSWNRQRGDALCMFPCDVCTSKWWFIFTSTPKKQHERKGSCCGYKCRWSLKKKKRHTFNINSVTSLSAALHDTSAHECRPFHYSLTTCCSFHSTPACSPFISNFCLFVLDQVGLMSKQARRTSFISSHWRAVKMLQLWRLQLREEHCVNGSV